MSRRACAGRTTRSTARATALHRWACRVTGLSYRDTRKLGVKKPTATQPKAIPAPAVIRERIWSTVINGTELVIEMVVVPGSPDSYDLFVGDGTSWHGIANYDDLHSLAPEAQQWQAYLRNGGTVAAWLETWS